MIPWLLWFWVQFEVFGYRNARRVSDFAWPVNTERSGVGTGHAKSVALLPPCPFLLQLRLRSTLCRVAIFEPASSLSTSSTRLDRWRASALPALRLFLRLLPFGSSPRGADMASEVSSHAF